MTKIYLYCTLAPECGPDDVLGFAIGEDGQGVASHLSSNIGWSKYDMSSPSKCKHYSNVYPNGYELEWVDDTDNHEGLKKALLLNEERHGKENEK